MVEVKRIKIVTDIFDDEKVLLIESIPEADGIIVITTNYNFIELKKKLGGRGPAILSRISSMCIPVCLTGKDW